MYSYHPHHHGMVADQIFAGLFGAIIVEDPEPIEASAERLLVISDTTPDDLGNIPEVPAMERMMGREGELILVNGQRSTVNGQRNPQFSARPGQRERWRIINTCVARYLRLRLDGQQMQLLGMDSGRFPTPESVDELLLTSPTGGKAQAEGTNNGDIREVVGPVALPPGDRPRPGCSTGWLSHRFLAGAELRPAIEGFLFGG